MIIGLSAMIVPSLQRILCRFASYSMAFNLEVLRHTGAHQSCLLSHVVSSDTSRIQIGTKVEWQPWHQQLLSLKGVPVLLSSQLVRQCTECPVILYCITRILEYHTTTKSTVLPVVPSSTRSTQFYLYSTVIYVLRTYYPVHCSRTYFWLSHFSVCNYCTASPKIRMSLSYLSTVSTQVVR